jgi:peptidoglycan/LPS O-acetylase OafA/YrhL
MVLAIGLIIQYSLFLRSQNIQNSFIKYLYFINSINDSVQADGLNSAIRWLVYVSPYSRAFEFFTGVLIAQSLTISNKGEKLQNLSGKIVTYIALVITVILYLLFIFGQAPVLREWFGGTTFFHFLHMTLLFLPSIALLIYCSVKYDTSISRFLASDKCVFLGGLSYSLYINHYFTTNIFNGWGVSPTTQNYPIIVTGIMLTFLLSIGTYFYLEVPCKNYLNKIYMVCPLWEKMLLIFPLIFMSIFRLYLAASL